MSKSKTLANLASCVIVGGALYLAYRVWREGPQPTEDGLGETPVAQAPTPGPAAIAPAAPAVQMADPARQAALKDLARQWEETATSLEGTAREPALKAISEAAVSKLGPGPELLAYLDFLAARGEMLQREWLLTAGLCSLFTGPRAEAALEWTLKLPGGRVSEWIWFASGFCFKGIGFDEYLGRLPLPMAKDRVLTGYCCRVGESDAVNAIDIFLKMRPAGVTFYPLKVIMRQAPENADFAKLSAKIPADFDPKNSLAVEIRRELMKRWAQIAPERAAEYIMATPQLVSPEQMAIVVAQWAATAPGAAAKWLEQAAAGPARDCGLAALARHWAARNPEQAWVFIKQVADPQKHLMVADLVAMEWRRTDPAAANRALAEFKAGPPSR